MRTSQGLRLIAIAVGVCACRTPDTLPEATQSEQSWVPVREVRITAPREGAGMRGEELRGLVTALVELGAADLPGAVPRVDDRDPAPGLDRAVGTPERFTVDLTLVGSPVVLRAEICSPQGACTDVDAPVSIDLAEEATAMVLRALARSWPGHVDPTVSATWSEPSSTDPYARLLAGRSAQAWYGWLGEVDPDPKRGPIGRAVVVDPSHPVSLWIAVRDTAPDVPLPVRQHLDKGVEQHRTRVGLQVAWASIAAQPLEAWQALVVDPDDARFVLPRVDAALGRRDAGLATQWLARVPSELALLPAVLERKVSIADLGPGADDALLAQWQQQAQDDPRPVRRRLVARMKAADWVTAEGLVDALAQRGAGDEALAWSRALHPPPDAMPTPVGSDPGPLPRLVRGP